MTDNNDMPRLVQVPIAGGRPMNPTHEDITIPTRHGIGDALPDWTAPNSDLSDWERQEIHSAFRSADRALRDGIARLVNTLNVLHDDYNGGSGHAAATAAMSAADAASHLGYLHHAVDAAQHRQAMAAIDR